jgi:hypothetical protein
MNGAQKTITQDGDDGMYIPCRRGEKDLVQLQGTFLLHMQSSFGPNPHFEGMFARCYYKNANHKTLTNFIKQITQPKGEKKKRNKERGLLV